MSDWAELTLGELAEFSNGANFTKASFGEGIKIIGVGDFGDRVSPDWPQIPEVDPGALTSDRQRLEVNDILVVRSNGNPALVGRSMLVTEGPPATHSAFTIRARPDTTRVDPRFLGYQLRHAHKAGLMAAANGTNITNLNQTILGSIPVLLPDIGLQRRIASILGAIDDLIENNRRRIALLEQMTQAIYREWFVHFRYPGHADDEFADSPIGSIPGSWEAVPVSDAIEINPLVRAPKGSEVPFVAMGDLEPGLMIVEPGATRQFGTGGSRFTRHDTLFARITPSVEHGKTGFVQFLNDGEVGMGSTEFLVFRGRRLSPYSTYLLARRDDLRKHAIGSMFGASGRQRVNSACFDTFAVAVAPVRLEQRFASYVAPAFASVEVLGQARRRLELLRDILLPKLVTGAIDVSKVDLDALLDEPAA